MLNNISFRKCKLKLQGDSITHWSEWLKLEKWATPSVGDGPE